MIRKAPIATAAVAVLAGLTPAAALAAHGEHHRGHDDSRRHHHHNVRVRRFGHHTPTAPTTTTTTSPTGTTTTPTTTTTTTTPTTPSPTSPPTAGTVASFNNGVLTLTLANGSTVSGTVDRETEIECEMPGDDGSEHDMVARDHSPGGPGAQDTNGGPGDDNGGGDNGGNDDNGGNRGNDDNGGAQCTVADLTPGAVVQAATLDVTSSGSFWDEIELGA